MGIRSLSSERIQLKPFQSRLDLQDNQLESLPMNAFGGLFNVRQLWLNRNKLLNLTNGAFEGMGQLAELDLCDNQLIDIVETS